MNYYGEVRRARLAINGFVQRMKPSDELSVPSLVLAIVSQFEVSEKMVKSHISLLVQSDDSLELNDYTLRRLKK